MTREMIMEALRNKGYEVEPNDVTKNGMKMQAIAIGSGKVRPNIYVDEYIESYTDAEIDDVVSEIIKIYERTPQDIQLNMEDFLKWDNVKTRLQLCIQRKSSENMVKRDFLDLEQYVRVIVHDNVIGTGSIKVKPELLEKWNIDADTLFHAAWDCTKPLINVEDMGAMMAMLAEEIDCDFLEELNETEMGMTVITTKDKTYGAVAMCDTELLSEIAEKKNSDLVILPSSIHDIIVRPFDDDIETFNAMVKEVNATQLAPEEVLSNHAYIFRRNTRQIEF